MGVKIRVWHWPLAAHSISPRPFPMGRGTLSILSEGPQPANKGGLGWGLRAPAGRPAQAPCPSGRGPDGTQTVTPPPPGDGDSSHLPTPWGHVCAGSAPGTARGRARPPTPGRQPVGASAGPGPPPPPPEPSRRGSRHLPRPPRRPWAPQSGRSRVGAAEGRGPAGTHRALRCCRRRRRRARLPAVPRARLLLGAEARPLGAARAPPPAPGPRQAGSGSPSRPPRPLRPRGHSRGSPNGPSLVSGPPGPTWAMDPGISPGGPRGGRECWEEGVPGQERSVAAQWALGGD
uniref:LOW QUALITY PROTEIN: proapoptotic nucleolar protein 1 n=1 Tax=Odobenus rosmarus divergens TaxID=9708 RepID=UPI00063C793E|nr:PREDICTED: LOW QUALITY PROTEIN: proapoptotic nucleolar protein 1 [Odobenus rosmarus divergens]